MKVMPSERRTFTRVKTRLSALWHRREGPVDATLRDLTLAGALLSGPGLPDPGEEARITLPDEAAGTVRLRAQVVRTVVTPEGPAFAISFLGPDRSARQAIANHLLRAAARSRT